MKLLSILSLSLALLHAAQSQTRGTIRLVRNGYSSSSYSSGIVQIYYFTSSSSANRWGNICDDSFFGYTGASVICHQLGYTGISTFGKGGAIYGNDGSATILNRVNCGSSSYLTLEQCSLSTVIPSSCTSDTEDAYVSCITTRIWSSPYSGQIRLRGGTYSSYGRLEVYCNRQWGTVCNNTFDSTDAKAACRQLGYSNYNTYEILAGFSSQPIWLDRIVCSSSSNCISSCESCPTSQYHTCIHGQDVALGCEFNSSYSSSTNTLRTCNNDSPTSRPTSSGGGGGNDTAAAVGSVFSTLAVIFCIVVVFCCIYCCNDDCCK